MIKEEFFKRLHESQYPVVVDFWAPWCMPCRAIEPVMEKLSLEYAGRVDAWKINADKEPDLLRALHLYGIPTLIAYHQGQEISRHTGTGSAASLGALFEAALSGKRPERAEPAPVDRLLRLGAGLALIGLAVLGGLSGLDWVIATAGALVMFTAVYDRCPIYRMVSSRLKEYLRGAPSDSLNS